MKKFLLLPAIAILFMVTSYAQVAINTNGSLPHSSAMLDVTATNKGVLIPRLALTSSTDATTVPTPATYLMEQAG